MDEEAHWSKVDVVGVLTVIMATLVIKERILPHSTLGDNLVSLILLIPPDDEPNSALKALMLGHHTPEPGYPQVKNMTERIKFLRGARTVEG
jgi:hypothetical protein